MNPHLLLMTGGGPYLYNIRHIVRHFTASVDILQLMDISQVDILRKC